MLSSALTSIPVSAVDVDTERPVISVQRTFLQAIPGHDYLISVLVEDNKGVENVTIDYTIFSKFSGNEPKYFPNKQMVKNNTTGRYEYTIPGEQISPTDNNFTFSVTARDVHSLRAVTDSLSVMTTNYAHATTITPSSYYENPRIYSVLPTEVHSIDGYIHNDTEYPLIIVPTYCRPANPSYGYPLSAIVQDNKGIQKVTLDYVMGEKHFTDREMTRNPISGRYEYEISRSELTPHGTAFTFTITATNTAGLKTITDGSSKVYIDAMPTYGRKPDDFKVTVFAHNSVINATNSNDDPRKTPKPIPQDNDENTLDKTYVTNAPITIKDALGLNNNTENITVTGQIAYFAKEYANPVIQSVIDGTTYSLYIYGSAPADAKIGDQVKLTGTYVIDRGFPMLKAITSREIIGSNTPLKPKTITIAELKTKGLSMLGQFVKIESVKLGTYNAYGLTEITDATGTINILKAASFSTLVKEGDIVDLYATVACANSTIQLFTGTEDANGYTIYDTVKDTTPPAITIPDYYKEVRTSQLPFIIPAIIKDNKGVQKVTITYTIGDKTVYDQPMYERTAELYDKSEAGNNYAYKIPEDLISDTTPNFTFVITATDVNGLKTVSESSTVNIIHNFHVTAGPPNATDDKTQLKPDTSTQNTDNESNFDDAQNNSPNNYTDNTHITSTTSTIKEVLALENDTENVTVTGQIAYFATEYDNPVIQSVIDGTTYSLYVKASLTSDFKIGDQVKLKGTYAIDYRGVPMLKEITAREKLSSSKPIAPETVTIEDLKENGSNMIGRFVKIKEVTLGTYEAFGLTEITDATGSINLYKATPYPTLVKEGDVVDLYATVACNGSIIELNTGTKRANGYSVYDAVNDTKPPLLILPDNLAEAQTSQDYHISVTAEDNKDIQEVTITYTIGDKTVSDQKMIQNTYNGNYDYRIPHTQLLDTAPNFSFTITATDVTGLKTVSEPSMITINDNPKLTSLFPAPDTSTDFKPLSIGVIYINGGVSPKVTYTIKNDKETLIADKTFTPRTGGIGLEQLESLPAGNYTAIVTLVRSEDGKTTSREWHFSVTE